MQIQDTNTINQYYTALLERDQGYVGIFYVGVKTTSIFCIATCRARKPKKENVIFYTDFKDSLDHGYRPCKICKPTQNSTTSPEYVIQAIELVKANPKLKIKDQRLREEKIDPIRLRRWFQTHYGMTFHIFQRMYRINIAYREVHSGKRTTDAAFDSGYESLSGFGYTYKQFTGVSPKNKLKPQVILIKRITTPLGPMFICATEKGICLLEFVDRKMLETEFKDLQKRLNAIILAGENKHIIQVEQELEEYFSGKRKHFTVKLDTPGTEFQKRVWKELHQVKYGTTCSYQDQATRLGQVTATRAVARANGYNRVAIIIPCHRVIGKNGKLTGYGGGLERKKWLFRHEISHQGVLNPAK